MTDSPQSRPTTRSLWILRGIAVIAILGIGAVHLDLYYRGDYHFIPTIGPLFVVNAIAAAVLAVAFAVRAHWTIAIAAIGFSLGTLAGYVWSLEGTLFKFHEPSVSHSGILAIVFEGIAVFSLMGWIYLDRRRVAPTSGRRAGHAAGRAANPVAATD